MKYIVYMNPDMRVKAGETFKYIGCSGREYVLMAIKSDGKMACDNCPVSNESSCSHICSTSVCTLCYDEDAGYLKLIDVEECIERL